MEWMGEHSSDTRLAHAMMPYLPQVLQTRNQAQKTEGEIKSRAPIATNQIPRQSSFAEGRKMACRVLLVRHLPRLPEGERTSGIGFSGHLEILSDRWSVDRYGMFSIS
ncbi:hypothetical protein RRG08_058138 [Elysia crispata]|uniref:Uncharacterized protein n=1 Tax=Elysia crispata TaxID=231223 RepID=A0AAE0YZE8_9GAST|nr:hypothetical protein RRG08_058138 [Elysia crispata]